MLKGDQATRESIWKAFRETAKRVRSGDYLVFYFAGHGTQVPDRRPFDELDGLDEALCPYDADDRGEGLVLDDDLGLWLDDVEAGQVTVILDCCHSGTGTKAPDDDLMPRFLPGIHPGAKPAAESPWRELRDISKAPGRQTVAFFACRPDQQAYERLIPGNQPPARRGQFSYYFLEGLPARRPTSMATESSATRRSSSTSPTGWMHHSTEPGHCWPSSNNRRWRQTFRKPSFSVDRPAPDRAVTNPPRPRGRLIDEADSLSRNDSPGEKLLGLELSSVRMGSPARRIRSRRATGLGRNQENPRLARNVAFRARLEGRGTT